MAFDKYFESLSRMIGRDQTEAWANDLEQFGKQFNQFAGLPTQERDTNNEEKEAQTIEPKQK
jgi:hypothetical protein